MRNRGFWKKKNTYSMFYGDFNHNGMIWAMFLMLKSLLVGVMLTTCDVEMCSVPCPCQQNDAKFAVRAPLSFGASKNTPQSMEIVCDNCERQCPSPVDTKIGIFCSGECQWSAHFARRDLRKW